MGGRGTTIKGAQTVSPTGRRRLIADITDTVRLDPQVNGVQIADLTMTALAMLGADPVTQLKGIGTRLAARLAGELGITTLAELTQHSADVLARVRGVSMTRALDWIGAAQQTILMQLPEDIPPDWLTAAATPDRDWVSFSGTVPTMPEDMPQATTSLVERPALSRPARITDGGDPRYELIDRASLQGKRSYALLDQLDREWHVITRPVEDYDLAPELADTFGLERPTFQWVKDGKVVEIYVDGMDEFAFYEALGLRVDLTNATTTAKRISRIFRPQAVTGFFQREDVDVAYIDDVFGPTSAHDDKTWDGAGVVSRQMLHKMIDQLPNDLDPRTRARMTRELRYAQRVEFTIMTEKGQEKGHAVVAEDLDHDFVLPRDVKTQVQLTDPEQTYVTFEFPHGATDMRLDIQSMVNLYPFFDEHQLLEWLQQEGDVFIEAVRSGHVAEAMRRVDQYTTLEDLEQWGLREFLVSDGDIHWSGSHVKSFFRSAIKRLQTMGDGGQWDEQGTFIRNGKVRVPIPGGRFYVMPAAVGQAAGKDIQVARGDIFIDDSSGTAWVNDDDWYQLDDGASEGMGIAEILGGADNDDALWVHNFTDTDGQRKVLAWRSPNQAGEYVVLRPSANSHPLTWQTLDGEIAYPAADSRLLPKRRDHQEASGELTVLNLIDQVDPPSDVPASGSIVDAMRHAADRELVNKNLLGATCNWLMVHKCAYGDAPMTIPDKLEDIIDLKKTGYNGGAVLNWVQGQVATMLDQRRAIPDMMQTRLGQTPPGTPRPRPTVDHWLDRLQAGFQDQLTTLKTARDELAEATMPPIEVFEFVHDSHRRAQEQAGQLDYYRLGIDFNQRYHATRTLAEQAGRRDTALEEARIAAEDYLFQFPDEAQDGIVLGAMVASYAPLNQRREASNTYDGLAWLMGSKDESGKRERGIFQVSLRALRKQGVLNAIVETDDGIVSYPEASVRDRSHSAMRINGVYRAVFDTQAQATGRPRYDEYDRNDPQQKTEWQHYNQAAREQVRQIAASGQTIELDVRAFSHQGKDYLGLYSVRTGQQFGTIDAHDASRFKEGDRLIYRGGFSKGGDIAAVVEMLPQIDESSDTVG